MSENASAAEWLRGIIVRYEDDRAQGCFGMAKMFGIDCNEETCRSCMVKLMTAIADRIDAERALPDGMEWPRFEDGELVKVGDEVEYKGETMRVYLATFDAAGWALWCSREGIDSRFSGSYGERVKRPAPEVLDADGVPIEVGDTVWATYNGCKLEMLVTDSRGRFIVYTKLDGLPKESVIEEYWHEFELVRHLIGGRIDHAFSQEIKDNAVKDWLDRMESESDADR